MAKKKEKYYVVWHGRKPGIYSTWDECKAQVEGFAAATYKSYKTSDEAKQAFELGSRPPKVETSKNLFQTVSSEEIIWKSISVDAAWNTATGDMEYQGVYTDTKEPIFKQGPYANGTNNVGEYLAIVHALAHCKKQHLDLPIYTDSATALAWIRKKKHNSKLEQTAGNAKLFDMLARADKWLKENSFTNQIIKWRTDEWGEIAADYGRK